MIKVVLTSILLSVAYLSINAQTLSIGPVIGVNSSSVSEAENGDTIEIWGNGNQTRSFLYIDDCIDGVRKLMNSDFVGPVNIGSEEKISLNDFAKMIIK